MDFDDKLVLNRAGQLNFIRPAGLIVIGLAEARLPGLCPQPEHTKYVSVRF